MKLEGFDDMIKRLEKAGKNVDFEVEKCFSECAKTMTDTLVSRAKSAKLDDDLINKIERKKWHKYGVFYFEVGWEKVARSYGGEALPDVYKVMFYNYGTPLRATRDGQNRGKIEGRGFIKKAKLSAINKVKKIQKDFLARYVENLKQ